MLSISRKVREVPRNLYLLTQRFQYVDVYQTWKRDSYLESLNQIHASQTLKPILAFKTHIANSPNSPIPISSISKRGLAFGLDPNVKVAAFLRLYPSVFEESQGLHGEPWFGLTEEARRVDEEESVVWGKRGPEVWGRLRRVVGMSRNRVLPVRVVKGMLWGLGFSEDALGRAEELGMAGLRVVEGLDGEMSVEVLGEKRKSGRVLSVLEMNALKRGEGTEVIAFPLFPSRGVRLRRKIEDWLEEFQKLPYVSPYEDYSGLDPSSDVAEKRVVAFLHELLCLFVDHSAERKKLLCLKKYFGLPQKVHKAFERHPHIFYLSFRNKTCTAILKEAYRSKGAIPEHPMLGVRKKYIELVKKSDTILRNRRTNNRSVDRESLKMDLDLDSAGDDWKEIPRCS